jgi:hypothetical protein
MSQNHSYIIDVILLKDKLTLWYFNWLLKATIKKHVNEYASIHLQVYTCKYIIEDIISSNIWRFIQEGNNWVFFACRYLLSL